MLPPVGMRDSGCSRGHGHGDPTVENIHMQPDVALDQKSLTNDAAEVPPEVADTPPAVGVLPGVADASQAVVPPRVVDASQIVGVSTGGVLNKDVSILTKFRRMSPPTFDGKADSEVIESFLSQCGRIFENMGITDDQLKVSFTVFQLTGKAIEWWNSIEDSQDVEKITWDKFKEMFWDQFFPLSIRDAKRDKFMNLTQGSMTVLEYEHKFLAFSKYAPEMISTESDKCRRFESGLRPAIRDRVALLKLEDYKVLVFQASTIEIVYDSSQETESKKGKRSGNRDKKRQREALQYPRKKKRQREREAFLCQQSCAHPTHSISERSVICYNCRQSGHLRSQCPHAGRSARRGQLRSQRFHAVMSARTEQRMGRRTCYRCGQQGHEQRDCPQGQGTTGAVPPLQPSPSNSY